MTVTVSLGPMPRLEFIDNLGKPAAFGQLFTYDWNTRQPKPTYQDPGAMIFWSNPIQLDSVGRPQGQIYWETDVPYYLELRTATGALIWSTAVPYVPASNGGTNVTTQMECCNLFINGQFRYFPVQEYSPLPLSIDNLADGGWSFVKDGTNPTASITFKRYTLDNTAVPASPTFYLNYVADQPGVNETRNDIVYTISDVRSLANELISIGFNARSAITGSYSIEIFAIQYFGTGGSPSAPVITNILTITPTTTAQTYTGSITLPSLVGKTLGTNGDDCIQFIYRLPINSNANIELTNAYLKRGAPYPDYPYQTNDEEDAIIKALELPNHARTTDFDTDNTAYPAEQAYDALTLVPNQGVIKLDYLPTVPIGTPLLWFFEIAPAGFLLANGQTLLQAGQYNRLYNTQYGTTKFGEMWGEVANNLTAELNGSVVQTITQMRGVANPASAGTTPFTVNRVSVGFDSRIARTANTTNTSTFTNTFPGAFTPPAAAGTSGLTITVVTNGSSTTEAQWTLTAKPASALAPGDYFQYDTSAGSFYNYLVIDGVGTDPVISGRIGHPVYFNGTDSDTDVNEKLALAIAGFESSQITCTSAIQISPGAYFQIGIVGQNYTPYYIISGSGAAPSVGGAINVPINILLSDTSIQVAAKTQAALNPLLFQMPKPNGYFPRFWDNGAGVDPDAASRGDRGDGVTGDHTGTTQDDELIKHEHTYGLVATPGSGQIAGGNGYQIETANTSMTGGNETRAKNIYFSLIIKY